MAPKVSSATYQNVPVWETTIRGHPVMMRKSDYFVNATHILKLAGLTKPKRTKILEREVLKGYYDKVQGGYGKVIDNTRIPIERARYLASQHDIGRDLHDLLQMAPDSSNNVNITDHTIWSKKYAIVKNPKSFSSSSRTSLSEEGFDFESDSFTEDTKNDTSISKFSSSIEKNRRVNAFVNHSVKSSNMSTPSPKMRKFKPFTSKITSIRLFDFRKCDSSSKFPNTNDKVSVSDESESPSPIKRKSLFAKSYSICRPQTIEEKKKHLAFLISQGSLTAFTLKEIISTQSDITDFEINMPIDSTGNTAIHIAAAHGKLQTIEFLLEHGALDSVVNNFGETPLMVSIFALDNRKRTVIHHIASSARKSSDFSISRDYMNHFTQYLLDNERDSAIVQFVDRQDANGDTALHIACRFGNAAVVS
ncbi:hypothetical protein HK096_007064, partial [Nowakowskiella sp. JEL0078]